MEIELELRVGFAGTPEFARTALDMLRNEGFTIPLVLTQPDRPAGRGMRCVPSPVKAWALEHGVPLCQPRSLRREGSFPEDAALAQQALLHAQLDVLVVAAYGLILPQWVLSLPRRGCINIHASLLPRWRGAAPIQRAIEAGDTETGVCIMQMDAGLDTGPLFCAQALSLTADETLASLQGRLAALGGALIVQVLRGAAFAEGVLTPQAVEGVCYAHKVTKAQALVSWDTPATELERRIRAFDPAPGAHTVWHGQPLKLWRAQVETTCAPNVPGTVLDMGPHGLVVQCAGASALRVTSLQRPGGRRLDAPEFFQGQTSLDWLGHRLGVASEPHDSL